jgi:hypothetical protein
MAQINHLRRIRFWLSIFVAGLLLSGVTAFPLQTELDWLNSVLNSNSMKPLAQASSS